MTPSGPVDDGFATVWAAAAIAVILIPTLFAVYLGTAAGHRHRAEAAADLAALAAAVHALEGEPVACAYALRVLEPMRTRMISCRLTGWQVSVEVETRTGTPWMTKARGRARAGPTGEDNG